MYIGCLNDKLKNLEYQVYKKDTRETPTLREDGNPFKNKTMRIHWSQLLETGVDFHISVEEGYFLNELVLHLGAKSNPTRIKLYTADKKTELFTYSAETGKTIQDKTIVLPIESKKSQFVVEINVAFSDVTIDSMEIYGVEFTGEMLFPIPKECVTKADREISVETLNSYSYDCEMGAQAAEILKEKFEEFIGIVLEREECGKIHLAQNADVEENGYNLTISEEAVKIESSDLRGMVYGIEVFLKIISEGMISECEIQDAPRMPFRGVHLMLPHPSEFDFAKRLVKYVISPMGYNCIIMEIAGGMEFESHPEINRAVEEAWEKGLKGEWPHFPHGEAGWGATVKKDVLRDFVAYCRTFGVDVIPEIQSLGHVQFMTVAHPDIAERAEQTEVKEEIDGKDADIPPNEFYGHSYCPSNPKSYEILFDLIDEIVDVFSPKEYVHMGHDEVYQIGVCPRCKDKSPAELLAEDVNRIHAYLAKKGLKMMIWADMFQKVTKYQTSAALDKIPEDIILLDFVWYFHMNEDIEDNLLEKNRKVVLGNMYSSHYPRYESRVVKEGIVGAQTSTWVTTREHDIAREGKMYELLYAAQMMWSADYTSHVRYSYDKLIGAMMPKVRAALKSVKYPSIMEDRTEVVMVDNGMYQPNQALCQKTYDINRKAESIIFEHATTDKITRIPWVELEEIGAYRVIYEDGAENVVPLTYSGNISHWNRRHSEPFTYGYYRHNGYQAVSYETDGVEAMVPGYGYVTMYRYEWVNPNPEKLIRSIEYVAKEDAKSDVYISRLSIVQ